MISKFRAGHRPADAVLPIASQLSWWFAFRERRLLVIHKDGDLKVPLLINFDELSLIEIRRQYLGDLDGRACFSVELDDRVELPEGFKFVPLRKLYQRIEDDLFWLAGRAIQIVDWDQTHQYCGRCGALNEDKRNERAKECPKCGLVSYPRISPAIIVLVEKEGRILLARAHRHPPGFYSVLAGFVEPGETLEEAVSREIREEVGLEVSEINYFGSQPWPYPNSLMVAFTCSYRSGEIVLEEEELEDAGWYTTDNLPPVPPKLSIARQMIDWFSEKR